ncbi:extracellular catalytic domain type 1 short-chain-length polyhydroxyalkanoate depolymerase [Massilia sp. SYSU DXS3249]
MKLNNKLFSQMRAATRSLLHKPRVDTNKVIQDALKNASAMTQAAQQQMQGLSQANAAAHTRTPANVADMLAELNRNFGHGGGAANEPAEAMPGTFSEGSHTNGAGTRSYKLYVPSSYTADKPVPLVVMLHGCTQDPDDFAHGTQMNTLAEETGCLVVYPAQSRQANSSRCWNWFNNVDQQRDQGEPSIIAGITREIMARHTIDPARVYVAGLSAGGAMATIMGTLYPDLYAAVGVHSGLPFASAHDLPSALAAMQGQLQRQRDFQAQPGRAIPIIVFHGDQDHTVHPTNGDELMVHARDASDAMAVEPGRVPDGHAYTRTMHKRADGKVHGEHWVIHGAGHAWSGGSARGSYTDGKGPDASREMMRFFSTHR